MHQLRSPSGVTVSYVTEGDGPPLVLVHGSFTDHRTNWQFVQSAWVSQSTVYAVARRGRGRTDGTVGHEVTDEAQDVASLIGSIGTPVDMLGHSYGGQVALAAAAALPDHVRRLILYEPPWPHIIPKTQVARLEAFAAAGDWAGFATAFFRDTLAVPLKELEQLQATDLWDQILADAEASLGDIRALTRYPFHPEDFRSLGMPVMLQIGAESPRDLYVTDALAAVLPDARIEPLPGQAHDAMMTAPQLYGESVLRFLL